MPRNNRSIVLQSLIPFTFLFCLYGCGQRNVQEPTQVTTETVRLHIPLFLESAQTDASVLLYRSDTMQNMKLQRVYPNTISLKNWECAWSIECNGEYRSLTDDVRDLSNGAQVRAELRYRGRIQLDSEILRIIAPQFLLLPAEGNRTSTKQKNVLIVMIDTLRQDSTSAYNHPYMLTSHLDVVRSAGAGFENAYAPSSSTRPSVGSLLTGYYPQAHGSVRSGTTYSIIHAGAPRLSETFRQAGYRTGGFHSNGQVSQACGFGVGFDTYEGPIWDPQLSERALQWLDADSTSTPWVLYVHYIAPHHPYDPPAPFDTLYSGQTGDEERDRYLGEITSEDGRVGQLLAGIAERGLWNDTVVWIVSDHGEEFWEHGWKWHGASLYDEVTRVVSLISAPWLIHPGTSISQPQSLVDVPATLYDICSIPGGDSGQGQSLAEELRDNPSDRLTNRTLYLQLYAGIEARPHRGDRQAVLQNKIKTIWKTTLNTYERYDLKTDPAEKQNLWDETATPQSELTDQLQQFMNECQSYADRFQHAETIPLPTLSPEEIENIKGLGYIQD